MGTLVRTSGSASGTADGIVIIVEDGTLVPGADSYNTIAEILIYEASYFGTSAFASLSPAQQYVKARQATQWMDSRYCSHLRGYKVSVSQEREFPRYGIRRKGTYSRGYYPAAPLPREWKDAHARLAIYASSNDTLFAAPDPAGTSVVKRTKRKLGPLEVDTTYVDGANATQDVFNSIEEILDPLLKSSRSSLELRIVRA